MFRRYKEILIGLAGSLAMAACVLHGIAQENPAPAVEGQMLDPAAWGEDHVGKPLPDYVTGDECLFCHRNDIGPTFPDNKHARTIRFADKSESPVADLEKVDNLKTFAAETEFLIGRNNVTRFLKTGKGYGKMDIASFKFAHGAEGAGGFVNTDDPHWDTEKFAKSCAGCHATAVESESAAFGAFSLDCYSCHGDVTLDHTNDTKLMHLSRKRSDRPHVVTSICAQCHLRGGKSKSTGRPYPNQFVAGDNLFKDFEVNFTDEYIEALNPADRHIYRNVRDVVVRGVGAVTCLDCHQIHANTSAIHTTVRESQICADCHTPGQPMDKPNIYKVYSEICEY